MKELSKIIATSPELADDISLIIRVVNNLVEVVQELQNRVDAQDRLIQKGTGYVMPYLSSKKHYTVDILRDKLRAGYNMGNKNFGSIDRFIDYLESEEK